MNDVLLVRLSIKTAFLTSMLFSTDRFGFKKTRRHLFHFIAFKFYYFAIDPDFID
jgi:hypothetical protein